MRDLVKKNKKKTNKETNLPLISNTIMLLLKRSFGRVFSRNNIMKVCEVLPIPTNTNF